MENVSTELNSNLDNIGGGNMTPSYIYIQINRVKYIMDLFA